MTAVRSRRLMLIVVAALAVLLIRFCNLQHSDIELSYIGPGAGFAFLGSFLTIVLSLLASFVSFLLWPFRMLLSLIRRRDGFGKARVKKVIFLGLDGLDPNLTENAPG